MAKCNDVVVTIEIAPLSIPYYGCKYLEKFQLDSGSVRYILTRCDICLSPPNKQFERDQLCCQFFVASTKLSKRRKSWISILWKAPIIWITKCALCSTMHHKKSLNLLFKATLTNFVQNQEIVLSYVRIIRLKFALATVVTQISMIRH